MDDFTLSGKKFCKLIESLCADKSVFHIKVKGHGNSMSPFIKNGEELIIKPAGRKDTIKPGDIVAVVNEEKEKIIVHRVIGRKNNFFQIKGDNCSRDDGYFPETNIIGIVTGIKTDSGKKICYKEWQNKIIAFLSKTGWLNMLILPLGRFIKKTLQKLCLINLK